jgi:glycine oxidase
MSQEDSMPDVRRVTIVGGGVIGCFLAYRLALEGLPVTMIERASVGAGATGASAGNVQPGVMGGISDTHGVLGTLGAQSLQLHRTFLPAIKEASGLDPLDHEVQYFYAALDEQEVVETRQFTAALQEHRLRAEWIDGPSAHALDPRLAPQILGGALHQDCFQMDAYRFVSALSQAAQRHGVQLQYGEVVGLQRARERVTGVLLKDGGTVACETLVLTMGAWTGVALAQWLGLSVPIGPYALQKLHVRPAGPMPRCAVRWGDVNMVARRDGLIHVGSKHDPMGFEARPTDEGRHWLLERFQTVFPGLPAEVVEARAGLGAETPDRTPIVGPLPGYPDVYVSVPSTNGFLLSAVMADMLTALLVRGEQHALFPTVLPAQAIQRACE